MAKPRNYRIVVVVTILLLAGIASVFRVRVFQLNKEFIGLKGEIEETHKKVALLQRNYQEKRNMAESLLRAKRALDVQIVEVQKELGQVKTELETVRSEKRSVSETLSKNVEALQGENQSLKRQVSDLNREKKALEESRTLALAEHKKETDKLSAEKREMESSYQGELKRTYQSLEKCSVKNARLCVIAGELLDRYENKGVFSALMDKEPLTQIERVDLEKLVEEYKGRIEEQKITKKQ